METGDNGTTYVVDVNGVNGKTDWEDKDSVLRKHFYPQL